MNLPISPSREEFLQEAARYAVVPVSCELVSDVETPVSAFRKLADTAPAILLESAEQNEQMGRYSFIGLGGKWSITAYGHNLRIRENGQVYERPAEGDPFRELETVMVRQQAPSREGWPSFFGGAVGYLGYDCVRWFEPVIPPPPPDNLGVPDMYFFLTEAVVIFDHFRRRMLLVANTTPSKHANPEEAYSEAVALIQRLLRKLRQPVDFPVIYPGTPIPVSEPRSNTTRAEYHAMVEKGKEYIRAGDIFQFVPAQRFETDFSGDPIELYRALRFINPSPYMFCLLCEDGHALVGSSPEVHVRLTNKLVEIRPIAGTRRRGATREEDEANEKDLLADAKERAEHLMLVDLARNDVGRIAEFSSVRVTDFMTIERYSHVMHIVSHVSGTLHPGRNAFDVMRATFPAGTVSGAPKVRAMQIINELEKNKRCTYAGAVGYFGWNGNLDSCITLRTVLLKDGKAYVQAGGGVVADSTPEGEYQESINKAMGMMRAIDRAKMLSADKNQQ